jgi:hypothetical protein
MEDTNKKDTEHLRLLAIFHFVMAGLAFAGVCILAVQYAFMSAVFNDPSLFKAAKSGPPPDEFFTFFKIVWVVIGVWSIGSAVFNLLSAMFLRRRRNRTFSMVVAGFNCLAMPLGTILGVFTFVVLSRPGVVQMYEPTT